VANCCDRFLVLVKIIPFDFAIELNGHCGKFWISSCVDYFGIGLGPFCIRLGLIFVGMLFVGTVSGTVTCCLVIRCLPRCSLPS
jgi:hypothetical protein